MHQELLYSVIASGSQIAEEPVAIKNARRVDIWCPAVNSTPTLQLYGSFDQTSAHFVPVEQILPNTGGFATPGSRYIALGQLGEALPPYVKPRLSAAQADTRTLVFVTKL